MPVSMHKNAIDLIKATARAGFAYVIRIGNTGRFKIGHSDEPDTRIATFGTIATEPLSWCVQIPSDDPTAIEKVMKDYLQQFRVPGLKGHELFEPPLAELDAAIAVAQDWNDVMLPDLAAAKLMAHQECDPALELTPTGDHWDDYRELMMLRQIERRAQQAQTRILVRWQLHMDSASSLDGIATWKHHYRPHFDRQALLTEHPQLAPLVDKFTTQKLVRRFLPHW